MSRIVTSLWFDKEAREAVEFYVSVIPNSTLIRTTVLQAETPSGPPGSVSVIDFTLDGRAFSAMEARAMSSFNHSVSITVLCDSQDEIDRIWDRFLENGGVAEACGWLKDRWGLSWQITPRVLLEMIADPDRERAKRAAEAMLQMVKIEIAPLEKAFNENT